MKKIICVGIASLIMTGMSVSHAFTDVPTGHWAESAINKMVEQKIISGNTDGTFRPSDNLRKIQGIILLAKAAGVEKNKNASEEYMKKYDEILDEYKVGESNRIFIAYLLGLDVLREDELENYISVKTINSGITREEMAILVTRVLGKEKEAQNQTLISMQFDDVDKMSSESRPCIQYLYNQGIMRGITEKEFRPKDYVTRAQAAVILNSIVDKITIKPELQDEIVDNTQANITLTNGVITDIDTSLSTLEIDEEDIYEYDDKTEVYIADKSSKVSDIKLEMKVTKAVIVDGIIEKLELNGTKTTEKDESKDDAKENLIIGEIVEISTQSSKEITVKVDKKQQKYNVVASTKFYQAGTQVTIYDFIKGDEVALKLSGKDIKEMYYSSEVESGEENIICKVGTIVKTTNKKVTIKLTNGKEETFEKGEICKIIDAEICEEIKLKDVEAGKNIVAVGIDDGEEFFASVITIY